MDAPASTIKTPTRSPTGTVRPASAGPIGRRRRMCCSSRSPTSSFDRAKLKPGERVIDVGCGSGATTIAFAREVAPSGRVLGVDSRSRCSRGRGRARRRICRSISCWPMPPSIRSSLPVSMCWPRASASCSSPIRRCRLPICGKPCGPGPAGVRLLARAARKPVVHGAAAGGLQARAKTAAAGAGRSRPVRVCLRGARAPYLRRGRLYRVAMEACPLSLDAAIGRGLDGAVQGALEIGPVSRALEGQPADSADGGRQFHPRSADAVRQRRCGAAAGFRLDRDGQGAWSDSSDIPVVAYALE